MLHGAQSEPHHAPPRIAPAAFTHSGTHNLPCGAIPHISRAALSVPRCRLVRVVARALYRTAAVELLRIWTPPSPPGGGGGGGGGGGTGSTRSTSGSTISGALAGDAVCYAHASRTGAPSHMLQGVPAGRQGSAAAGLAVANCWLIDLLDADSAADSNSGTASSRCIREAAGSDSSRSTSTSSHQQLSGAGGGGAGGGAGPAGGGGGGGGGGGQLLRVRWRMTAQPWLPWGEEQRLEVIATYT